ncbi:hypothetical protein QAD02_021619 [Eretmocerus hayati]|uniref:Uncharacterized protein n=1 Tax=Eretmocerus hayati TaxID=131215 RepID=A0ACC2PSM2_9HYME|nr:hypothetical protein QAD02_021619 [Eretmocerus hayati]
MMDEVAAIDEYLGNEAPGRFTQSDVVIGTLGIPLVDEQNIISINFTAAIQRMEIGRPAARENPPDLEVHAAAEPGPEPAAAEFQVQAAAEPARADAGPIHNRNIAEPWPDPAPRPTPDAAQEQQRVEMAHPARKFYFCHLALDHA